MTKVYGKKLADKPTYRELYEREVAPHRNNVRSMRELIERYTELRAQSSRDKAYMYSRYKDIEQGGLDPESSRHTNKPNNDQSESSDGGLKMKKNPLNELATKRGSLGKALPRLRITDEY